MANPSFTTTFTVHQSPEQVFAAIQDVRGWWSGEIEGSTANLGDVFTYRYKDFHYSKQQLSDVIPNRRIAWQIRDSYLSFAEDNQEWTGTKIVFDITPKGNETEVRFTHQGLVPNFECFDKCSNAWSHYINTSLRNFITATEPQLATA